MITASIKVLFMVSALTFMLVVRYLTSSIHVTSTIKLDLLNQKDSLL